MNLLVGLLRGRQTLFFAVLIESILRVDRAVEAALGLKISVRSVEMDFSCGGLLNRPVVAKWRKT